MQIASLVKAAGGGALVLFTSRKQMQATYEDLLPVLSAYSVKMQGQEPIENLLAWKRENPDSVLFGTRGLMTGVDIQGNALRLVIVDKLPFSVPTEPVFQAKCELIENRGGNSFRGISIPNMTLVLEQAFGRLIRTVDDRGVVACLDSRLADTGWGKGIIRHLPPSPVVRSLHDVENFFAV